MDARVFDWTAFAGQEVSEKGATASFGVSFWGGGVRLELRRLACSRLRL